MTIDNIILFVVLIMIIGAHEVALGQYYFEINDFKATESNLEILGDAYAQDSTLVLTNNVANQSSAVWYKSQGIDISQGFESQFTFNVHQQTGEEIGEGFAFIIQNKGTQAIGSSGGSLAYQQISNGIAIEFDTYDNGGEGSSNHISIMLADNTLSSYKTIATVHSIPEITDGQPHFAKIEYKEQILKVYLDSYIFPVLSFHMDMSSIFNTNDLVWLGFTASTGTVHSQQELLNWTARSYESKPEDIKEETVALQYIDTITLDQCECSLRIWDNNVEDGDKLSLKLNSEWILTNHVLKKEPHEMKLYLTGFHNNLVIYAQDLGANPPNTATIEFYDGKNRVDKQLNADFKRSDALLIRCKD